jgi:hypothetical protein
MDDQRIDPAAGSGLIPIARLVYLMVLGVLVAFITMPSRQGSGPKDLMSFAKADIAYTVIGAICGLLLELWVRARPRPHRLSFSLRALLITMTLVAMVLGLVMWLIR